METVLTHLERAIDDIEIECYNCAITEIYRAKILLGLEERKEHSKGGK